MEHSALTTVDDSSFNQLLSAVNELDMVVFKKHLDYLTALDVYPLQASMSDLSLQIRSRKLTRITYDQHESVIDKFTNVFSTLHNFQSAHVAIILKGSKTFVDIYLATKLTDGLTGNIADTTLVAALKGNFPGMELGDRLTHEAMHAVMQSISTEKNMCLASVSGVPSLKSQHPTSFVQGLEKMIDGMQGKEYVSVLLGVPVSRPVLDQVEAAYQGLYTALSQAEGHQLSLSINETTAVGQSVAQAFSTTLSQSTSQTQAWTKGTHNSTSTSVNHTQSKFDIKRAVTGTIGGMGTGAAALGAAGATVGMGIGSMTGAMFGVFGALPGAIIGSTVFAAIGAKAGGVLGAFSGFTTSAMSGSESKGIANTQGQSASESATTGHTETVATGHSETVSQSDTQTYGTGQTIQLTQKNRIITDALDVIDQQLVRIQTCKNYGMWSWAAYFTGESEIDVTLAANLYSAVLKGEASGLERNSVTVWNAVEHQDKLRTLLNHVSHLEHPLFHMPSGAMSSTPYVSNAVLISTPEVALAMSFPRKSLPGLPVVASAEFGRSIHRLDHSQASDNMIIGAIQHLGTVNKQIDVTLDLQSFTGHTLITGSTGTGKSNAIYSLLTTLYHDKKIPFLVIEPAKGEYKSILGGLKGVNVFATNPAHAPLLRLNPFSFPPSIHVMEHIERLIDMLNAIWPMHSAMPVILKDAVEKTYEHCGWDLISSECRFDVRTFPDVYDLLDILPTVINQLDYSEELKSNYIGALVVRVKSLTTGQCKLIFQKNELPSDVLFDQSCIVDLSRVGSAEIKSLLMGVLFLKLQEYRMDQSTLLNADLRHVTVLEEAHHLLRRTSSLQSADVANVQGKSVEMIANAIAEMRTYGEGFIIADQSPGLLDQSVIRNTNTKIILRLPDLDDRQLVGKAAYLNEQQITELARLPTGTAAIYQNNWLEPVLCQFTKINEERVSAYHYQKPSTTCLDPKKEALTEVIQILARTSYAGRMTQQYQVVWPEHLLHMFPHLSLNTIDSQEVLLHVFSDLIQLSTVLKSAEHLRDVDAWVESIWSCLKRTVYSVLLTVDEQLEMLQLFLDAAVLIRPSNKALFDAKFNQIKRQMTEGGSSD